MSKIFLPTRGNIDLKYPIKNPLINLSSGMLQNCNALENIMLKYLYAGMSKQDAINDTRKILDFAQLGEFENLPLRTYSTGMKFRLSFSIAIQIPSEIIILDEWLSVSDANFRDRVYSKFNDFMKNAKGIVMASNNRKILEDKCSRIINI